MKRFAFTIDLEADYAGFVDKNNILNDLGAIENLLSTLTSFGTKITAFTVGSLFETHPEVIELFAKYKCEFEAHSYSHDFKNPDSETEVINSREAYYNYFKKYPTGYRSPRGIITPEGIKNLEKHGFQYDSSIFPSYFPNPFRYLFSQKTVHYHSGSNIMEIPFSSISPMRLTLSISYIKLFGVDFFIHLSRHCSLPDVLCFDSHLHDFITSEPSFNKLSSFWKLIYGRNKYKGTEYCMRFLEHILSMGYTFCYMSEIYESHKKLQG